MRIKIPANMRAFADQQSEIEIDAPSLRQGLDELVSRHPELRRRLLTDDGNIQSFVNIFINEQSVRELDDLDTPTTSTDEILIIPALAGG